MRAGDVVLVKFPFTSLVKDKKRPALVLKLTEHSSRIKLVTVAMITSKIDGYKIAGDVLMQDWEEANLLHPSILRMSKIATVDDVLIDQKLGSLSKKDMNLAKASFQRTFADWV